MLAASASRPRVVLGGRRARIKTPAPSRSIVKAGRPAPGTASLAGRLWCPPMRQTVCDGTGRCSALSSSRGDCSTSRTCSAPGRYPPRATWAPSPGPTTPLKALTLLWAVGGPVTATGLFAGTFLGDVGVTVIASTEIVLGIDFPDLIAPATLPAPIVAAQCVNIASLVALRLWETAEKRSNDPTMSPARVDDEECNNECNQSDSAAVTAWTAEVSPRPPAPTPCSSSDPTFPHPASVCPRSSSVSSSHRLAHSALAAARQTPRHGPPNRYQIRAERQRLERVRPPSHPAVEDHDARAVDAGDHLGQRVESGRGPVQLSAAVVAHPHAGNALLRRAYGTSACVTIPLSTSGR